MKPLPKADLEDLHSILRRAAERAEAARQIEHARRLREELAALEFEMRTR